MYLKYSLPVSDRPRILFTFLLSERKLTICANTFDETPIRPVLKQMQMLRTDKISFFKGRLMIVM